MKLLHIKDYSKFELKNFFKNDLRLFCL